MDANLCDELLQEIFNRLPPRSSSAVSLVSKRWLRLLRSCQTSISLTFVPDAPNIPSLSSFLSHHPYLSSLSIAAVNTSTSISTSTFSDHLLHSFSTSCPNLRHLRFLAGPVSLLSLLSLSTSCPRLSSLTIALPRPLSFHWLLHFLSLQHLSVVCSDAELIPNENFSIEDLDAELRLETLSLSGIRPGDYGLNWLWKNCKNLKKLKLRSCEGIGSSFLNCLNSLQEVELMACRTIVDRVLSKLAENCTSLNSLLVYDGGSKEGLLQFITLNRCNIRKLDLRLPLDLMDNHLSSIAENIRGLSSLRLQSCCLITGEGLRTLGVALSNDLEELALINCDVVERETGLLATLGQNFRRLRKLDLSHSDTLIDKELVSMLVSCNYLVDLKLRGCGGLTNAAVVSMFKNCKNLECVDLMRCGGIGVEAIELFLQNSPRLRQIQVEECKLSDVARMWASNKFIELLFD